MPKTKTILTLGDILDALDLVDPSIPVATDTGDDLMNPMPAMPVDDGYAELTLTPVPTRPGQPQSVGDLLAMFSPYAESANGRIGRPSPLISAPLGSAARVFTGVGINERGVVLTTARM